MMLNDEAIRVLNCVRSKCMMIVHECLEDQAEGIQEEDMPDWISWQHFFSVRMGRRETAEEIIKICEALIKGEIRGDDE